MKRIFIIISLIWCSAITMADEMAYQEFLRRDPDYARIDNEEKELIKKSQRLRRAFLTKLKKEVPGNDPESKKKREKMNRDFHTSYKYHLFSIERRIKNYELKMRENRICAAAEAPADLAIIRERYMELNSTCGIQGLDQLPKKDIPGSPEFQYAMYAVDLLKEEEAKKSDEQKARERTNRRIQGFDDKPVDIAERGLYRNLQRAIFDAPEWRKANYEAEYGRMKYEKRYTELELANIDLYVRHRKADSDKGYDKSSKAEKEASRIWDELYPKLTSNDPLHEKLYQEAIPKNRAAWQAEEDFINRSDSPAAMEYRQFRTAREAVSSPPSPSLSPNPPDAP